MTHTAALPDRLRNVRTDIAPLTRPDHADYLALLSLTTASGRLPAATGEVLTMDPVGPLSTHGTALCLTARLRRSTNPKPVGAVFASSPDWAFQHPLVQGDPGLSHVLSRTALLVYGVAVAPGRRRQGTARALLTETEDRARATGYRMTTLIHTPDLAPFYERLGYTTAHQVTIAMPEAGIGLTQPPPYMTAVKVLRPDAQVRILPGAPGPCPVDRRVPTCRLAAREAPTRGRGVVGLTRPQIKVGAAGTPATNPLSCAVSDRLRPGRAMDADPPPAPRGPATSVVHPTRSPTVTTPRPRPASVTARIEDTPAPPPHSQQETFVTGPQLDLDAITTMPRTEDVAVLVAEVRRLRTEPAAPAAPAAPDLLRTAYIAALDEAHHTHPCPVTGRPYWLGCVHPDGQVASCHSRRRADAVLAVRDTELERLRAQNRHLIGQLAKKATHSDADRALLEFPGADGTADLAAADNPTQLRWGLGDVLWGDDDTVTVLLSGPQGEPYWLELGEERAAALRENLAGPGQDEPTETQQVVDEHCDAQQ